MKRQKKTRGSSTGSPENRVRAKKKYGQNFLKDAAILDGIVECAGIGPNDHVLEIGPGLGAMTGRLCESAGKVTAVEIDKSLIPHLEEVLSPYDNVELIQGDILKTDLKEIADRTPEGGAFRVVANLPYYITTPIVTSLLEASLPIESITVMVQKEVAERFVAEPGSKECGAISLAVSYYAEASIEIDVPPECFTPRPKVSSSVINLRRRSEPPVQVEDEELMFAIIRASFNQRRKTLVNGIAHGAGLGLSKEEIESAITSLGESATVRGEVWGLDRFAALSNVFSGMGVRKNSGV
ncbi:MAG: 16S rRNA (adenine(1518)-N(6)/adenine(1519)-N(6))-dimethyltransferase RsmA [Eubacterium sp.]|nr:16S rRNA (adenine(1518)-N(6)/adenine(1519)-N(6))-dimethyltransferase RsmA [Eubacterium sp.]